MVKPLSLELAAKRKRTLKDYPWHEDYRTRWSDNDTFNHLNNPVYGVVVDSIINSYLMQYCGYDAHKSEHSGLVANTYCDYFGSASYPGMLNAGLRIVKMGKSSIMYEVGIFQEGDETVKAVGGLIQIWVDKKTNKPPADGIPKYIKEPVKLLLKGSEQDPDAAKL